MVHNFSGDHVFKADSLTTAETLKNNLCQFDYNQLSMTFAPLVCNSFGPEGPDLLRFQCTVADITARRIVSVPTLSLPASALVPSFADQAAPQIQTFKRPRQNFFRQSAQEILVAILEGVCERVFCRTYAMQSYPEYLQFFALLSVPWYDHHFCPPLQANLLYHTMSLSCYLFPFSVPPLLRLQSSLSRFLFAQYFLSCPCSSSDAQWPSSSALCTFGCLSRPSHSCEPSPPHFIFFGPAFLVVLLAECGFS